MKYPVCTLGSILNPGTYYVVSTDNEHVLEIKELERKMRKEMSSEAYAFDIRLSPEMCVAVIDSVGLLKRGIIEKQLNEDLYQVLLMDYGEVIQVKKSKIKAITNKSFIEVEPLAFILKLYGLIPVKHVKVKGVKKSKACKNWLPKSKEFVQSYLKKNQNVVVQSILIDQRTVYGDLFIKSESLTNSLSFRKMLCKNRFCVYSESNFLIQEGLSSSNEDSEFKKKMKFVEKWQKENFGEGPKNVYPFPAPMSSFQTEPSLSSLSAFKSSESAQEIQQVSDNVGIRRSSIEQSRTITSGRGKLRLLIQEMKNAERLTGDGHRDNDETNVLSTSSAKSELRIGRGRFLKKLWDAKKSVEADTEKNSNQNLETPIDVGRTVLKPKEFPEIDSTWPTKRSLSMDENPASFIQNLIKQREQKKKSKQILNTSKEQEFSPSSEQQESPQSKERDISFESRELKFSQSKEKLKYFQLKEEQKSQLKELKSQLKEEQKSQLKEEQKSQLKEEQKSELKVEQKSQLKEEQKSQLKEEQKSQLKEEQKSQLKEEQKSQLKEEQKSQLEDEQQSPQLREGQKYFNLKKTQKFSYSRKGRKYLKGKEQNYPELKEKQNTPQLKEQKSPQLKEEEKYFQSKPRQASPQSNEGQKYCLRTKRFNKLLKYAKASEEKEIVKLNKQGSQSGSFKLRKSFYVNKSNSTWKRPLSFLKIGCSWTPFVSFYDNIVESTKIFKDLSIKSSIIENIEKEGVFRELNQLQRWAIPTIRKQHDVVIISSSKSGKTLSYLIPVINCILESVYSEELSQGNGPAVVIVASTSRMCESIYYTCHSLLGNTTKTAMKKSKIKIVLAHGNGFEKEVWVNLTNGCDIVISTPHCLVRLLETPILVNFERLACLIFDEIDIISENPFRKSIQIIIEKANFSTRSRCYQKILIGDKWTPSVESFLKTYVTSYAIIINSFSEAVIFKKLKPSLYLVDKHHKAETLLNIIKGGVQNLKTLIVCEGINEAIRLNSFLMENEIFSLFSTENISVCKLREIQTKWKNTNSILIATDGILNELNIQDVQTLIHFELPSKSKTNFYLRFSTLKGFYMHEEDVSKFECEEQNLSTNTIILIDDENHRQLPHIMDFVARLGVVSPSKILRKCEEIRRVIEIEKNDIPICSNLLSFGRCKNFKDCYYRHVLIKTIDSPSYHLPNSGWVNFDVLRIYDASRFYVKLVEHVDSEGKITKLEDHRWKILSEVSKFFMCQENQKRLKVGKNGDVCAVKTVVENEEVFYRAKIIECVEVNEFDQYSEVKIQIMDEGGVWKRKVTELFKLPDILSNYPPTAVEVCVVGIQPMDFDANWTRSANNFLKKLMNKKLEENQYWSGKIALALNNTLFLDSIQRKEYLPLLKTHVFSLVVQNELIKNQIAVSNSGHLSALMELCDMEGIEIPNKEKAITDDSTVIQPQWAFFESNFVRVTFLAAENTSTVFLQPKKFEKVLRELEEDCQKEAEAMKAQRTRKAKLDFWGITPGMFCLALFENGHWNRGRIESENDTQFYVFFVDHGDFLFLPKADVIPISQALLLRLPCQAIECTLVGIQSKEECPLEVLKEIYSFSRDGKEDLYAYILDKDLKANITNGRKYKLNLLNKQGISLNKMLVDSGMVCIEESESNNLEDVDVVPSDNEESLEEEDSQEVKLKEEVILSDEKYWEEKFGDDVFKDEIALDFLKDFASKVFLSSSPLQNSPSDIKEHEKMEACLSNKKATEAASPEQNAVAEEVEHVVETKQNDSERRLKLKSRENVWTPQVLWCQNQLHIEIKIILGNVKDYSLECTTENISFRCFLNEKFYAVDFKLFGSINPQMTKIYLKAFHVLMVLTKLASPLWPRLHADREKHRWINLDVESLVDKGGIFSEKIGSAEREIESGILKDGIRIKNIEAYSESSDDSDPVINVDSEDSQE